VKVKKKSAHTCGIPYFVVGLQGTGWKSKPENSVVAPASTKPDSFATCTAMQLIRLRRRRRRRRRKLYCCRALFRFLLYLKMGKKPDHHLIALI
jgi:hypothetical protein